MTKEIGNKIHLIGIGGIGMSALARFFVSEKKQVSGSDGVLSDITKRLAEEGVQIFSEHSPENITDTCDLVVYTEAINAGTSGWPELEAARAAGIPTVNYFEALGAVMNPYYLIAVAGTHGKTTTTAMLTDVFEEAGKDPTAVIGSLRAKSKSNFRAGKSKYALVEACEYRRDFLSLTPDVLVITNIEHEHTDYYRSLEEVQNAFRELIGRVHDTGVVITNPDDPNIAPVIKDCTVPVVDYTKFIDPQMEMKQPGMHNRLNAAVALAVAKQEGINEATAKFALANFAGTWRRFEYKGEVEGAKIYDDYAHHPTEIRATLSGTRELYPDQKIIVVFQPHTFSRTASMFDDFAKSLAEADKAFVLPIYAAREEDNHTVSSRELAVKVLEYGGDATYVGDFTVARTQLAPHLKENTVVIFMGAGNVTELANDMVD